MSSSCHMCVYRGPLSISYWYNQTGLHTEVFGRYSLVIFKELHLVPAPFGALVHEMGTLQMRPTPRESAITARVLLQKEGSMTCIESCTRHSGQRTTLPWTWTAGSSHALDSLIAPISPTRHLTYTHLNLHIYSSKIILNCIHHSLHTPSTISIGHLTSYILYAPRPVFAQHYWSLLPLLSGTVIGCYGHTYARTHTLIL